MNAPTLFNLIWEQKFRFVLVFFVIFTASYAVLYAVDFLPEPIQEGAVKVEAVTEVEDIEVILEPASSEPLNIQIIEEVAPVVNQTILPMAMRIVKLEKTIQILNPSSRSVADLDAALLDGVVRHPDSASLDQEGNVFVLGHSSYLPNVFNKNFQAFNGIEKLEWGDVIEVSGGDQTFVYRVEKVYQAKATELVVPIADTGHMLTLATCNSFGSTDDRYIVEAKLETVRSV